MKIRHEIPITTSQFGCNSLMQSQMQKIMSGRGACFVSNSVYFCLLPPTDPMRSCWTLDVGRRKSERSPMTCYCTNDKSPMTRVFAPMTRRSRQSRAIRAAPIRGYPPSARTRNLHQPTSFTNQRGKRGADRVSDRTGVRQTRPSRKASERGACIRMPTPFRNAADGPVSRAIRAAPIRATPVRQPPPIRATHTPDLTKNQEPRKEQPCKPNLHPSKTRSPPPSPRIARLVTCPRLPPWTRPPRTSTSPINPAS